MHLEQHREIHLLFTWKPEVHRQPEFHDKQLDTLVKGSASEDMKITKKLAKTAKRGNCYLRRALTRASTSSDAKTSAQALFDLLEIFRKASGLMINFTSTEGMWIGSSRNNKTKPLDIKWPSEPIKALGVFYTYVQKLLL